jgi:peptidoglycan glycosyltransferase
MKLQKLAMQALGNKKGAVVVLNPKTGAVLALASQPTYNPNRIDEDWPALSASADGVLLNRALQGRFAPGSAFKIVTTAAALADGQVTTDTVFDAPANLKIYGGKVTNYEGKGYGKMTLADAFAKSVNTVFAQVGKTLGGKKLAGAAGAFGLDGKTPFDIATAASSVPSASDMDELEVSWMAVGQGRLQLTPLNVALVGAAIANGGKIMQPYLVQEVKEHSGTTIFKRAPKVWKNPISPEVADSLRTLMEKVVEQGTGKAAKIDGVEVAGKTGTAEVENKAPHAWFVGFAPAGDPQAVVAVIVENGGTGGKVAAPIAKEILAAALGKNR